jgi:hypothetical protein
MTSNLQEFFRSPRLYCSFCATGQLSQFQEAQYKQPRKPEKPSSAYLPSISVAKWELIPNGRLWRYAIPCLFAMVGPSVPSFGFFYCFCPLLGPCVCIRAPFGPYHSNGLITRVVLVVVTRWVDRYKTSLCWYAGRPPLVFFFLFWPLLAHVNCLFIRVTGAC